MWRGVGGHAQLEADSLRFKLDVGDGYNQTKEDNRRSAKTSMISEC